MLKSKFLPLKITFDHTSQTLWQCIRFNCWIIFRDTDGIKTKEKKITKSLNFAIATQSRRLFNDIHVEDEGNQTLNGNEKKNKSKEKLDFTFRW